MPRIGQPAAHPVPALQEPPRDRWPFKGWHRLAAHACDKRTYELHLSDLTPASRALLSQAGLFAARVFNVTPTRDDVTIPSALFRVLLLRRSGSHSLPRRADAAVRGS